MIFKFLHVLGAVLLLGNVIATGLWSHWAMARRQPGFLSFKSYVADDAEVVALSEWESEDAALAWRRVAEHGAAQSRGRAEFYEDYTLFACKHPRIHRFSREDS